MNRRFIDHRSTGRFAPIVLDHLAGDPALAEFQQYPFTMDGLERAVNERTFGDTHRRTLSAALGHQYTGLEVPSEVRRNLDLLGRPGTLTVTTGHQLCLFTGPLYVPYKILNAVHLARRLSRPGKAVVPVFWMASEDHDRAEIDHVHVQGRRFEWQGTAGGPVGRMPLEGAGPVLQEFCTALGPGTHADDVRAALTNAYRPGVNLAQATRALITHLFGRFGVVVVDGDDPDLKRLFAPIMKEEALNQVVQRTVRFAEERMHGRYAAQAHAREINLFHMSDVSRARIELREGRYKVLDGGPSYSMEELLDTLEDRPQVFSPNVLLRPLYQETVLPNVAVVGGGGEVAYWLQLRWLFQAFQVPMPVVVLRTSALLVEQRHRERLAALGLSAADLFAPIEQVRERLAVQHSGIDTDLSREREAMSALFEQLAVRARSVDPTLEATVRSGGQKNAKVLEQIEQKLVRAAKQDQELALQRLDRVHAVLFPEGQLQERHENILPLIAQRGPALLNELLSALDPMEKAFAVIDLDQ